MEGNPPIANGFLALPERKAVSVRNKSLSVVSVVFSFFVCVFGACEKSSATQRKANCGGDKVDVRDIDDDCSTGVPSSILLLCKTLLKRPKLVQRLFLETKTFQRPLSANSFSSYLLIILQNQILRQKNACKKECFAV